MQTPPRSILLVALGAMLGVGLSAGFRASPARADAPTPYDELDLFAEVFTQVRELYVEPVSDQQLIEAAIDGMMAELDPHSRYLTPDEYAAMRDTTRGEYVGVGIELGVDGDDVIVGAVFPGGPAADAGVVAGDRFVSVDGQPCDDLSTDEIVERLRGLRGDPVTVELDRGQQRLVFELVRDIIQLDAVSASMPIDGVGLIRVSSFAQNVGADVRDAIDDLEAEHGTALDGLVLDLRGNPGGLLNEGIQVANLFLDQGVIVSTSGRDGRDEQVWEAAPGSLRYRGPLVVLVNEGTASASEIVAGALLDHRRAVVIGTPTYGKGSVQRILDLPGGSGMKLTISLYYTPSGSSIQNWGITPTLEVPAGETPIVDVVDVRGQEADLDGSLQNPGRAPAFAELDAAGITDAQLRAALLQIRIVSVLATTPL